MNYLSGQVHQYGKITEFQSVAVVLSWYDIEKHYNVL